MRMEFERLAPERSAPERSAPKRLALGPIKQPLTFPVQACNCVHPNSRQALRIAWSWKFVIILKREEVED